MAQFLSSEIRKFADFVPKHRYFLCLKWPLLYLNYSLFCSFLINFASAMIINGTITACKTIPMRPAWICDQTTATERFAMLPKINAKITKDNLPETCASNTAGNAIQACFAIFFENSPETTANTASSTTMNGSLASAGIGLVKSEVKM